MQCQNCEILFNVKYGLPPELSCLIFSHQLHTLFAFDLSQGSAKVSTTTCDTCGEDFESR